MLLDHAPCGFLSFRDDGTMVGMNRTLKELLEYGDEEPGGASIETILTLASRIFYNTHFFPLIRLHGKADEIFFFLRSRKGLDIPVLANAVRKQLDSEYVIFAVFIPVYQRKKYEQEILSAKKAAEEALAKNSALTSLTQKLEIHARELDRQNARLLTVNRNLIQFNKIISHDLQEPIHKIQLFANLVSGESANLSARNQAALGKILPAAERLRSIIGGLDQYLKIDTEKESALVQLNEVLEKAKTRAAEERRFTEFEVITHDLPAIIGNAVQLEILFFHIVDNAIQYRGKSKLVIEVTGVLMEENAYHATEDRYEYAKHVKITIKDNGIGFENKYNEYVFDLLTKLDPLTSGMGFGLALCKKIVDNHSGKIAVQSQPGKGTTVTVLLPVGMPVDGASPFPL